ncbi:MAG: ABC transporter permease [Clostridiales bacterium]|nr:ABC transporter permease [Clostridiales bacterium]
MKEIDINNIPAEKFEFAQKDAKLHDKKLETKPIGYLRDAARRFAKNKASIVGFVIIILLLLFAFIAPLASRHDVSYTNGYYRNMRPKISTHAPVGFWDGASKEELNAANYYYYLAIGEESGRKAVTKLYGVKQVATTGRNGTVTYADLYKFRLDSYTKLGYKFVDLTETQYQKLQAYQNDTGIQVIYPMQITTAQGSGKVMFDVSDANYWYKTYPAGVHKGEPVLDDDGNFIPIYRLTGNDNYNSLRIAGDPGIENSEATNRYRYAQLNQTGYRVRVCFYDYFVYQNGYEPLYILGSNNIGQDLLVCVASGTRFSFLLALAVSVINLIIGAIYGSIEGFYGGKTDIVMERISDVLSGVPFMVVAVLFNMHLQPIVGTVGALIFAFVLTGWIGTAATVRMQFYRFKNQEYVLAARTLGARDRRLITKHIFPNALGTIITSAALYIPSVIFSESMLSFLGIINLEDAASGITSLGTLLSAGQGASTIINYPHLILFPALVIALLMISFNLFGNGLRDAFNPSLRGAEE